jgi:hypothetical protein
MPSNALGAGFDSHVCEGLVTSSVVSLPSYAFESFVLGTECGKQMFVVSAPLDGGVSVGKTWFQRESGCASIAHEVTVVVYSLHPPAWKSS